MLTTYPFTTALHKTPDHRLIWSGQNIGHFVLELSFRRIRSSQITNMRSLWPTHRSQCERSTIGGSSEKPTAGTSNLQLSYQVNANHQQVFRRPQPSLMYSIGESAECIIQISSFSLFLCICALSMRTFLPIETLFLPRQPDMRGDGRS